MFRMSRRFTMSVVTGMLIRTQIAVPVAVLLATVVIPLHSNHLVLPHAQQLVKLLVWTPRTVLMLPHTRLMPHLAFIPLPQWPQVILTQPQLVIAAQCVVQRLIIVVVAAAHLAAAAEVAHPAVATRARAAQVQIAAATLTMAVVLKLERAKE